MEEFTIKDAEEWAKLALAREWKTCHGPHPKSVPQSDNLPGPYFGITLANKNHAYCVPCEHHFYDKIIPNDFQSQVLGHINSDFHKYCVQTHAGTFPIIDSNLECHPCGIKLFKENLSDIRTLDVLLTNHVASVTHDDKVFLWTDPDSSLLVAIASSVPFKHQMQQSYCKICDHKVENKYGHLLSMMHLTTVTKFLKTCFDLTIEQLSKSQHAMSFLMLEMLKWIRGTARARPSCLYHEYFDLESIRKLIEYSFEVSGAERKSHGGTVLGIQGTTTSTFSWADENEGENVTSSCSNSFAPPTSKLANFELFTATVESQREEPKRDNLTETGNSKRLELNSNPRPGPSTSSQDLRHEKSRETSTNPSLLDWFSCDSNGNTFEMLPTKSRIMRCDEVLDAEKVSSTKKLKGPVSVEIWVRDYIGCGIGNGHIPVPHPNTLSLHHQSNQMTVSKLLIGLTNFIEMVSPVHNYCVACGVHMFQDVPGENFLKLSIHLNKVEHLMYEKDFDKTKKLVKKMKDGYFCNACHKSTDDACPQVPRLEGVTDWHIKQPGHVNNMRLVREHLKEWVLKKKEKWVKEQPGCKSRILGAAAVAVDKLKSLCESTKRRYN